MDDVRSSSEISNFVGGGSDAAVLFKKAQKHPSICFAGGGSVDDVRFSSSEFSDFVGRGSDAVVSLKKALKYPSILFAGGGSVDDVRSSSEFSDFVGGGSDAVVVLGNLQDSYQQFQYQLSCKLAR